MVTRSLRGRWVWKKAKIEAVLSPAASFTSGLWLSEEQGPLVVRLSLSHVLPTLSSSSLGKSSQGWTGGSCSSPVLLEEWMCWRKFLIFGLAGRWGDGSLPKWTFYCGIYIMSYFHGVPLSPGNIHDLWKISFSWEKVQRR